MTKEKEDLRILRTRKLLTTTLMDMLQNESIEKISVIDICQKAMVHRTTFYTHFEDKYALLDFAIEEIKDNIVASASDKLFSNEPNEMFHNITYFAIDYIDNNKVVLQRILSHNFNDKIIYMIMASIERYVKYFIAKYSRNAHYKLPLPVISNFFTGGMMSILLWWLQHSDACSKDQLVGYVDSLLQGDV